MSCDPKILYHRIEHNRSVVNKEIILMHLGSPHREVANANFDKRSKIDEFVRAAISLSLTILLETEITNSIRKENS